MLERGEVVAGKIPAVSVLVSLGNGFSNSNMLGKLESSSNLIIFQKMQVYVSMLQMMMFLVLVFQVK